MEVVEQEKNKNVYFFWDYDLTEDDVRTILRGNDENQKVWVISRIVQYALWDDIWKYLKVSDVRKYFDRIYWRTPYFKDLWGYALEVWQNAH
jgi:hypothetical protein